MRAVQFHKQAFEQLTDWIKVDLKMVKRIVELIDDIQKNPFVGIGKPEPLKHQLKGYWSRRINDEHRLIYKITDEQIIIISCKYHYK